VNVEGKIWQQYWGFDLPAGTKVPLRVTLLGDRTTPPQWVVALSLSVPFALFALFVLLPIAQARSGRVVVDGGDAAPEQTALLASLADLEHDFEMGKISTEDRERLRSELRDAALARVSSPAAAAAAAKPAPETRKSCECGRQITPGDRFCGQCGRAL